MYEECPFGKLLLTDDLLYLSFAAILRKLILAFQADNVVHGGDPITQYGFSLSIISIACFLSACFVKPQAVPSGFEVLKSHAARPVTFRSRRVALVSRMMEPPAVHLNKCSFVRTDNVFRLATGDTVMNPA